MDAEAAAGTRAAPVVLLDRWRGSRDALRDALVAAGVASNRIQVSGKKAASTRARSAEVIIAP